MSQIVIKLVPCSILNIVEHGTGHRVFQSITNKFHTLLKRTISKLSTPCLKTSAKDRGWGIGPKDSKISFNLVYVRHIQTKSNYAKQNRGWGIGPKDYKISLNLVYVRYIQTKSNYAKQNRGWGIGPKDYKISFNLVYVSIYKQNQIMPNKKKSRLIFQQVLKIYFV